MKTSTWLAVAGGVAAVVAAAFAGATAYSGHRLQRVLQEQPRQWAKDYPFIEVYRLEYDRRFAGATRTTTLKLGCPGAEPLMLTWRDTVRHGPLPGLRAVGAAVIDSELVLDDVQRAELERLLGTGVAPLRARTVVGLAGGSTTEIEVPKFVLQLPEGRRAAWHGLQARWHAPASGPVSYELKLPGFEIADAGRGVSVKLAGAALRGEGLPRPGLMWALAGKGSGEIAALELRARPTAEGAPVVDFAVRDLKLVADARIDDTLLYHASSTITGRGHVGGSAIDGFELQASVKRMHAPSYEALMARLVGASCDPGSVQRDPEALQAALLQLLPHNPEYALDKLSVTHAGRQATLSYAAGVDGVTEAELRGAIAPVLMTKASLRLDLRVPAAWFDQIAPASQAPALPAMIDGLVQQGLLQREGEVLAASVRFAQGALSVNGRPLPLPLPAPR